MVSVFQEELDSYKGSERGRHEFLKSMGFRYSPHRESSHKGESMYSDFVDDIRKGELDNDELVEKYVHRYMNMGHSRTSAISRVRQLVRRATEENEGGFSEW